MMIYLPTHDDESMARSRRSELGINRSVASRLGHEAVTNSETGEYTSDSGRRIDISESVHAAMKSRLSLPSKAGLPDIIPRESKDLRVWVCNATTLSAAKDLINSGETPLALNFASGTNPGGGFLSGARAQEEYLCRSSALYLTLQGDEMYREHRLGNTAATSEWCILSPNVPIFRDDYGCLLDEPWVLSFITCAAPVATSIGRLPARQLLKQRIHRVLEIARAYQYETLVLGAWGCGAFGGDPADTAADFHAALEGEFTGAFSTVVFAITDWSPERRFLGPFARKFMA